MPKHNIIDKSGVRVMKEQCKTCIFRPNNLMSLEKGRVEQMIKEATSHKDGGGSIVCHSTLPNSKQAVCKGYFDGYKQHGLLQVAERLGVINWFEIKSEKEDICET